MEALLGLKSDVTKLEIGAASVCIGLDIAVNKI